MVSPYWRFVVPLAAEFSLNVQPTYRISEKKIKKCITSEVGSIPTYAAKKAPLRLEAEDLDYVTFRRHKQK